VDLLNSMLCAAFFAFLIFFKVMYFAKDMVKCISLMDNEWYLCSHISKIPMIWQVRKKRKEKILAI
jgi:hypothetical protein